MTHSKYRVSLTSHAIIAICLVFVAAVAMPPGAWSAGIMWYEQGTRDVGLASAGQGARAQDAGTVFTNPAGMTQLKDSQLLAGIVPNFGNFTFSPNAKTTLKGTNGGNAAVPLPGGSFFYVHSLTPNLKLGFGSYSYFGAPLEYTLNWVGRYRLQGATLLGMSFQPSFAFRAADWLSIGGGPNVMVGFMRAKAGINTLNPRLRDAQVRYQHCTAHAGGHIRQS